MVPQGKTLYFCSSNVIQGIRAVLFFKQKDFTRTKSTKAQKAQKVQKAPNVKQAIFFHLDVSYAHKNVVFFVFTHKKSTKSTKTQISEQATFFHLDVL